MADRTSFHWVVDCVVGCDDRCDLALRDLSRLWRVLHHRGAEQQAKSASSDPPDALPSDLSQCQRNTVMAAHELVGQGKELTSKNLAGKAGYTDSSRFRSELAALRRRGLIPRNR